MSNPFEEYRVTSPYGWRNSPFGKGREFHTGVDLVKEHNSPVYAFTDGEVIHAKMGVTGSGFGGYGNVVAIKDSKGSLHCYAHLDSCVTRVGVKVVRGQVIGRQGSTGQSTGSHLHYEIRKKSSPSYGWIANREKNCYDPTKYLKDFLVANTSNVGKKITFSKTEESWRVYAKSNKNPVVGTEVGKIRPKKYGGLSYHIIGNPAPHLYTIRTDSFGIVNVVAKPTFTGFTIK